MKDIRLILRWRYLRKKSKDEISRMHVSAKEMENVRQKCVVTTHTPVPAAFDQFSRELVESALGKQRVRILDDTDCCRSGNLNMTNLALRCSRYINGVAMHHCEISHSILPDYPIHAITNGVHAATWTSEPFRELYDRHLPEWRDRCASQRKCRWASPVARRNTNAPASSSPI